MSNPGDRWRRGRLLLAAVLLLVPALVLGRCVAERTNRLAEYAVDVEVARRPTFAALAETGLVVLTGYVPSEPVGDEITTIAQTNLTKTQVVNQFAVRKGAALPADPVTLFQVLETMQVPWVLTPVDDQYEIVGFIETESDRSRVISALQRGLGDKVVLVDKLTIRKTSPEPTEPAPESLPETTVVTLPAEAVTTTTVPAPKEEAAVEAVEAINETIALQGINFQTGSAKLTAEARSVLDEIAATLSSNPDVKVAIGGHTDNVGDPALNKRLSTQRAIAVRDALVERGVDTERMTAAGFGDTEPVADNATSEGRSENRRIEFAIAGS